MKVSVIIPAYNIENYIERCLDSVVNQTLKDIEIIIVNDGSIDQTRLKIEKKSEKDERILLINQPNKGSIEARKSGLNLAKGEYILFVDGDDWLELNALELLYENAIKNNSDIVLYQAFKAYDDRKELMHINKDCERYSIEEIFLGKISPALWTKFIKLEYIKANNIEFPSSISFAEDLATSISLFIYNPKISMEDIPLYNYYTRMDSITNKVNPKILEINDAFLFIKKIMYNHQIFDKYKDSFEFCVYNHIFMYWFLRYVNLEKKYSLKLYNKYKNYSININSSYYIREEISNYSLNLKLRIYAYNQSYKLGRLYDTIRTICKRGYL